MVAECKAYNRLSPIFKPTKKLLVYAIRTSGSGSYKEDLRSLLQVNSHLHVNWRVKPEPREILHIHDKALFWEGTKPKVLHTCKIHWLQLEVWVFSAFESAPNTLRVQRLYTLNSVPVKCKLMCDALLEYQRNPGCGFEGLAKTGAQSLQHLARAKEAYKPYHTYTTLQQQGFNIMTIRQLEQNDKLTYEYRANSSIYVSLFFFVYAKVQKPLWGKGEVVTGISWKGLERDMRPNLPCCGY